ncbi:proteasome maturation factor UMP1 [Dichotomopilus funicola]|uniref:Proteasome maturation factor UMP1 n=1 Tax=Dichotomopilus funicola TaxID=1934379 RepID=A0AAN6UX41_9PEZI|nr:proteasome maturation factor UMP1 [Dichotomopilus funicola]
MSLRIVPADAHPSHFSHIPSRTAGAPSAPGLHDTLRAGVGPSALNTPDNQPASAHPLEARLKAWESTRETLRMETLRRTYGVAEPVRRQMELKIAREGQWKPMALGGAGVASTGLGMGSVHEDILAGKDESITWEDVFTGDESKAAVGVHDEMEKKLKM